MRKALKETEMATVTIPQPAEARVGSRTLQLFTTEEYDEILRVGILREGEPVELLGGLICKKMPKTPQHMAAKSLTLNALSGLAPAGWHAVSEDAVLISGYDEPEPDVILRRGELRDYDHRKATSDDIALLVEVAVSSIETDRGEKRRAYAAAGIPIYWIVNLNTRCVEVYSSPSAGDDAGYAHCEIRTVVDQLEVVIDGRTVGQIAVVSILPAPPPAGA
jgi:Uma2 family endonuclease